MSDDADDKQHQATGKRLTDLRKQGNTLRSKDLTSCLVIISMYIMLLFMGEHIGAVLKDNFIFAFHSAQNVGKHPHLLADTMQRLFTDSIYSLVPILLVSVVAAFLSPFLFGGWNFSLDVIQVNFTKLDPTKHLKNLLSKRVFVDIARSSVKVTFILGVLFLFAINKRHDIMLLSTMPLTTAYQAAYGLVREYLVYIAITIVFVAIFETLYHFFDYQKRTKMSNQEVKDENKQMDGNPEVKRKIRSKQLALIRQRLSMSVPKANVIITNPTHYAVALRYDDKKDKAPKVVAKGKDLIADQIRLIAISHGIPLYQAPPLARSIYHTTDVGQEIHHDLYMAVAIVLTYVYQLKMYQQGHGDVPNLVSDFDIPPELTYDE